MPKIIKAEMDEDNKKIIYVEVDTINAIKNKRHRFAFPLDNIIDLEDLEKQVQYAIDCHMANQKDNNTKINELKKLEGENINA